MALPNEPRQFRTLFVSDLHLGSKAARTDMFLDFLKRNDAETYYLVGDIVDGWRLKRMWHWPQSHNDVVQKLLRKARKGARIVYVPGNHDEFLREFPGQHFGGVEVRRNDVHTTADGRKFLVMHGDEFDIVVRNARLLAYLGDWAYDAAIALNLVFNKVRRRLGFPYWSFSSWAKLKVKNAVSFIGAFEEALALEAKRRGCEGVICGHIHHAEISTFRGVEYVNTGDWVESCTAVGEHFDGTLELIRWADVLRDEHAETVVHRLPAARSMADRRRHEAA
ncbi:UDP-2,3-diacylglucosamine diphosphatase [Fulvimarina sp. 2208YS6-2-32]|uniref:UDP-2,3-diacylglucosamine diphosphatase n=1 Tax=Fulvimarina uroteuthidis TaxID=3098149 RepID=A0ABU5I5E1_9HYPH|nr:UDP-2,3-diacylglucosamine diphosphatase [Fulvimarina sp. 2208YS6-2-32]MDY8109943.1 UDP-2,3-diacylglucosamine diphosphatase [Fulvimarina sp. 2208YS6-2-32]